MVWYTYQEIVCAAGRTISIIWQLYYIATLVRTNKDAWIYVALFLIKPFARDMSQGSLWDRSWVSTSTEPNFNRMQSLKSIVGNPEYKQEITSNGNITEYLIQEYRKARQLLGDASTSYPPVQYASRNRLELTIVSQLLGDLHLFYCFYSAILYPSKSTLSTIATLPKAGDLITNEFEQLTINFQNVEAMLTTHVTPIYDLGNATNTVEDGDLPIPTPTDHGMSLRIQNVNFSYPGNKSDENALRNVSFSIAAGQVVVLVGSNGSGKSTILKLLTRMYDCSSGQVSIEGQDIRDCKLEEFRAATAILTQDHHIYPLSLAENIGLGNPHEVSNEHLISESARKGRAEAFISKYAEKYDTVLEPKAVNELYDCSEMDGTPLSKIYGGFDKKTKVSGGEQQRVAASRTFMRLTSGKIRLLIADEPSSNLDPQGEWELFQNILQERKGKTMIFVTHRFGHLTRHADLILCMKDGCLVEQGTHKDLMALTGEYSKLYEIQARAFTETTQDPELISTKSCDPTPCSRE
ncbi:P-loop containing nucleoside triphosphate hydrolase protein [Mycena maculata]|uniref:P-loop containing nucleoside triphosphate hydrolase protein n=1 Tax=Mycena maculata TaxID=230809 RepID=A0AAD7K5J7_9AGAR|nr:P-loop containing nucleoside triphosphate hydrolase protein [Mycena maculata]